MNKFKKRKEEQQSGTIVGYAREFAGQSETNVQNMKNGIRLPERFGHFLKKTKKKLNKDMATVVVAQTEPESDENFEPNTQCEIEMRLHDANGIQSMIGTTLPEHFQRQPIGSNPMGKMRRRKSYHPLKNRNKYVNHSMCVIDQDVWIKVYENVYENPTIGALLIDLTNLTPHGQKREAHITMKAPNVSVVIAPPTMKLLKSLPLKKQHTLGKRYIEQTGLIEIENAITIDANPNTNNKLPLKLKVANANAQKTKTEISSEANLSKGPAKLCADKSQMKLNATGGNQNETSAKKSNKLIDVLSVTKFSDNSSDSGYDETLHDTAQLNQIAKIGASRPVILSNGVKIHVQPQNLLLAANLAGVSQSAIQSTQVNTRHTKSMAAPGLCNVNKQISMIFQANMQATLLGQQKSNQPIRGTNAIANAFI